ncbi:MAG: phosphatidylglycerol lysyltransferase domain-containing protein [Clostridium sp.]|uniref:DUF2156 domain-containing protein n=1 Tax=Clostridium sp. TaxID=1506 RepID=UPI0025BE63FD|nr:DUF2156 domain-containing protein [Clostridium sp.]MCH3963157.1 phosphatidylglycerol lysyltransferase domain-containing protein [Clostridium sp.]MCI1716380.1 phosphatidylglycerol lysyltransferase domain-containing protein [Clostridium sp.]MCI1800720.1 phosphatidylglycerol lysyltransferase domain-containing protein [Clostridium sp.]MCI1814625.1 phosphatidylglycerol lysyltransferase domain-containing protein [Clostridium sp.]MCI1871535.1 phosphatidylglycerol lysyltransferase domain-containing
MLEFNPLTMEDKSFFDNYLHDYNFTTCEYSFTTLLIWRKACDISYTVIDDVLVLRKMGFDGNYYFMQPIGYTKENLKNVVELLKEYSSSNNMPYLFGDAEESFLEDLKDIYGNNIIVKEDVDNFDYLYDTQKLTTLSGKKLHSKKNHYNKFIKTYNYATKDFFEPGVKEDCMKAAKLWYDMKNSDNKYLYYELEGIKEISSNMKQLNLEAMAVYVDNEISAFTIGEKVNPDMGIIHIEKGITNVNGIYTFVNKTFVENYLQDVKYINREQDLGLEGLIKAKKSYHPIKMAKKYCIRV